MNFGLLFLLRIKNHWFWKKHRRKTVLFFRPSLRFVSGSIGAAGLEVLL
jgi:hypothetical protein